MSTARLFTALVGGVTRRPRLTLALAAVLGIGAVALALQLSPSAATSTFVSSSSSQYRATQRYYAQLRRRARRGGRQGQPAAAVAELGHRPAGRAGGMPVGQRPGERAGLGGRSERAVRAAGEGEDCEGGARAGNVRQRGRRTDRRTADRADQAGRSPGARSATGREQCRARARALSRGSAGAGPAGEQDHDGALPGGGRDVGAAIRADLQAEPRRSRVRVHAGVRLQQAGRHSQAALRLPVPEPGSGADLGADESRSVAGSAHAHDRADRSGGRYEAVAIAARRDLPCDWRAGDRLGSDELDQPLDRAAADRRAGRDGDRAAAWSSAGARACWRS